MEFEGPHWDPDVQTDEDERFTERSPHFGWLYEQAQLSQFSPLALQAMDIEDVIYLSGHQTRPPVITPDPIDAFKADTRWNKLSNNAHRASSELQRRWSEEQHTKSRRLTLAIAAFAGVVSVVSLSITASNADNDAGPPAATTTSSP